ncbi:D-galactarate dehydratase [Yoonia sp. F2084L]|uniref:D-galactarate dehydratase n=1 Tax=Yoonia sp. F2084L TaxID=2926419 RepID=UPI001FF282BC|nr:D-galactarate dehydratase [Yoonia sp. F2084L]MCK0094941.1 D-galactarate dehydratase [Yoonia sp. F2084L]
MRLVLILPIVALAGCSTPSFQGLFGTAAAPAIAAPVPTLNPTPPPRPPVTAVTAEQFDTTSQAERDAAVVTEEPTGDDQALGTTIASLGPPAEPGIWLKTPLVTALTAGRVEYQGKTINIELRPSGGAAGSGSQMSLAAMRLIEAPLTSLPEVTVYGAP